MTTILYANGRVYADSAVIKGSEKYLISTKICGLAPFRIYSDKRDFQVDDVVHGYTGTGNLVAMASFVASMRQESEGAETIPNDVSLVFSSMNLAGIHALGNDESTFEVMFLGEKANHAYRFDFRGFSYIRYELQQKVAMGSGSRPVLRYLGIHQQPLRAMLETLLCDEVSSAPIDIWQMRQDAETQTFNFVREGIFELRHDADIHAMLQERPYLPDDAEARGIVPDLVRFKDIERYIGRPEMLPLLKRLVARLEEEIAPEAPKPAPKRAARKTSVTKKERNAVK